MADHVKILAILHIVFGALGLLAALLILVIFGGVAGIVSVSDASPSAVPIWVSWAPSSSACCCFLPGVLAGGTSFQPGVLLAPLRHQPSERPVWHRTRHLRLWCSSTANRAARRRVCRRLLNLPVLPVPTCPIYR
jgi:hypothetical protein